MSRHDRPRAGSSTNSAIKRKHGQYTTKDLEGLSVAHELNSFREGEQVILTLKDKGVLDEGEDVLENVNIVDEEKAAQNVFKRLKKDDYNPYDELEYDSTGALITKDILSKYDEAIDQDAYNDSKRKTFRLGADSDYFSPLGLLDATKPKLANLDSAEKTAFYSVDDIILDPSELKIASDYLDESEMPKIKKHKKKKKTKIREPVIDDDLGNTRQARKSSDEIEDGELIDEDSEKVDWVDYEDMMEKQMRKELEKVRLLKLNSQKSSEKHAPSSNVQGQSSWSSQKVKQEIVSETEYGYVANTSYMKSGISFDGSVEFSSFTPIENPSTYQEKKHDIPSLPPTISEIHEESMEVHSGDSSLNASQEGPKIGTWNEVNMEEESKSIPTIMDSKIEIKKEHDVQPILEEEPDVGRSVASCLKLAAKKGYLEKEPKKLAGAKPSKRTTIEAQSYTIEEKFYDDDRKGNRNSRDRYGGQFQEVKDKSDYNPDIKLEYTDDSGRVLDQREAFRYLSHKFHGKGPGKNKIDKRLKKLEQESKMKQMSSIDTPLGSVAMMQAKQKEQQTPYIILNGGK